MDDGDNRQSRHQLPREACVTLNTDTARSASFCSVHSSVSGNTADAPDGNLPQSGPHCSSNDSLLSAKSEVSHIESGSPDVRASVSASCQRWLNSDVMPSASLVPDHHSTPVKEEDCLSVVSEALSNLSLGECTAREFFMPGELHTPILGYETLEARSKFTIFKIHVMKTKSEVLPTSWFVFRRYSDFVHLNNKLKILFPVFQLSLPPKRWVRDNFEKGFLDSRRQGLQMFLEHVTGHKDICNSEPVRDFFCTSDPPGPHDTLEESRALCDMLEESVYNLRQQLQNRDCEMDLLKDELTLYRSQVDLLSKQLRLLNRRKHGAEMPCSASGSGDNLDSEQCSTPSIQESGQDGQAKPCRL